MPRSRSLLAASGVLIFLATLLWADPAPEALPVVHDDLVWSSDWSSEWRLEQGQVVELYVGLKNPAALPADARGVVRWVAPDSSAQPPSGRLDPAALNAGGWVKSIHALDPDVYLLYRAPREGVYRLELSNPPDGGPLQIDYQRDVGLAPLATPPARAAAPAGAAMRVEVRPLESVHRDGILLETEPNSEPGQAVEIPFSAGDDDQALRVIGSADELEYFNNAASGNSPDDWYKIIYRGSKPKILMANLQLVEPVVSARIRVYRVGTPSAEDLAPAEPPKRELFGNANPVPYLHPPAEILPGPEPIYTYYDGRDINERIHQQDDNFRAFVTRRLHPGDTYYLRVEANQPAYELALDLVDPAPFDDPRKAVERSLYYHLAEIDAWLIHRPRNIAVHRRVRDGSSLFGENCMSCHTQSGVWGVADAFRHGYRPDAAAQSQRRLINTMYESLRPTIKLDAAASNTSLAPNDLGDAPAGSRVAGRNIVLHERTFAPKRLHSYQQRRTANYVLQTADPQGINAAGKGSNFGPNVVFKFAAEILLRAWRDTGNPKYFVDLEEKARKIVETGDNRLKVVDDLGHRIEFFHDLFPSRDEYLRTVARLSDDDPQRVEAARAFYDAFESRVAADLERLLALQQEDGGWGFDLGVQDGEGWQRMDEKPDAAPTAVSLIALRAAGYGPDDQPVQRAVRWLLDNQFDYGLWNEAAQTGFVTNAYVIRALSRLYPGDTKSLNRQDFEPKQGESFLEELARVRRLQTTARADFADLMTVAAASPHPQIRYYGFIGLGGTTVRPQDWPTMSPVDRKAAVAALIHGLGDPVKSCREAAFWSLRQFLLDDEGWPEAVESFRTGDARTRQSVIQALVTRADLSGPQAAADPQDLADLLAAAMQDPHPGVRAYAPKAAWRWWVWNPGVRRTINAAWLDRLTLPEPNADVEAALRYSTASMLIVNGQIANQTGGDNSDQQYPELTELYQRIAVRRNNASPEQKRLLDRRLTAVAATHFQERGNDGGPGQLGYSTPGASKVIGDAVLAVYSSADDAAIPWKKIALEGAANIDHPKLQSTLLELLQEGDLDMVAVAARALSNPQALSLPARPATLRPLLAKIDAFLAQGREADAEALANFLARVGWSFEGIDEDEERRFYRLLTPSAPRASARQPFMGKPAPEPAGVDGQARASLLGRILGENRTLQRETAFAGVEDGGAAFWLPSTEWMLAYEKGGLLGKEAVEGATEAEDLEVVELTFGRTTGQIVPDGLTSKNTILWWREGVPGAKLTFAVEALEAGSYELVTAFLYDREMGIVEFELNGEKIGESVDFYSADLKASGPTSLGVHPFEQGRNLLSVKMLGANPDAEPNHIFGIDYIKLEPDDGTGSLFTKNDQGVDVIDPIVAAKDEVVRMFTSWFDASRPEEQRTLAISLANKTALRRNPEVRKALADYVEHEPIPQLKTRIQNILNSDDEVYGAQLVKLINEQQAIPQGTDVRPLGTSDDWIQDVLHFRDYVFAEMTKINPSDNRACISCHGVPGRVPTLFLSPPDAAGYIPPDELLSNYRKMQQRVDATAVEKSKLLLKPLNIQTGEDDGHQGGVRYEPDEAGYQVIRRWVLQQERLQGAE